MTSLNNPRRFQFVTRKVTSRKWRQEERAPRGALINRRHRVFICSSRATAAPLINQKPQERRRDLCGLIAIWIAPYFHVCGAHLLEFILIPVGARVYCYCAAHFIRIGRDKTRDLARALNANRHFFREFIVRVPYRNGPVKGRKQVSERMPPRVSSSSRQISARNAFSTAGERLLLFFPTIITIFPVRLSRTR